MRRWRELVPERLVVPIWSAVLVLTCSAPWFRPGYLLSYDMVWVPHLDLHRREVWGLGTGLARAVPSDAVVALLGSGLPAAFVQRVVLMAALFLVATGAARLIRAQPLPAQVAAATLAVWNPYVAERLVLGQWPMLLALAAFPWLIWAVRDSSGPHWPVAVLALAGTALTPASGVMGLVVALVAARRVAVVRVVVVAALLNSPWIASGLRDVAQARTDPAAVGLFELQPEGSFGRIGSALTLGGIWNTEVVPTSRTLPLAVVVAVVVGALVLVGLGRLWRDDRHLLGTTASIGVVGLSVTLAGWLVPDLVARVVADVPAGGLVRDGTRWLALLVPLEAVAFGAGVGAVVRRIKDEAAVVPLAVLAVLLPVIALPDLAWGVGGRLQPVDYPSSWASARAVVAASPVVGDVVVLPFSAYRRPSWNRGETVLDPAGRYFDRTTVTNDELEVSGRTIRGEDPRAASVRRALAGDDVVRGLARRGVGVVVVETDAPGAQRSVRLLEGAREQEVAGTGLRVFTIDGARARGIDPDDRRTMIIAWGAAAATVVAALLALVGRVGRRLHRKSPKDAARQVPKS